MAWLTHCTGQLPAARLPLLLPSQPMYAEHRTQQQALISCGGLTITPWWRGRPTMEGKTARGASSPAKPAFTMPEPLSHTIALTSPSSAAERSGAEHERRWGGEAVQSAGGQAVSIGRILPLTLLLHCCFISREQLSGASSTRVWRHPPAGGGG